MTREETQEEVLSILDEYAAIEAAETHNEWEHRKYFDCPGGKHKMHCPLTAIYCKRSNEHLDTMDYRKAGDFLDISEETQSLIQSWADKEYFTGCDCDDCTAGRSLEEVFGWEESTKNHHEA